MTNLEYLKKEWQDNIKFADKRLKKLYAELSQARKLPLNCKGIEIDGEICENEELKLDLIKNYEHQIGYLECLKNTNKSYLNIINMNQDEFDKFLEREKFIEKTNKEFEDIRAKIDAEIVMLRELKAITVASAVTGKIKV